MAANPPVILSALPLGLRLIRPLQSSHAAIQRPASESISDRNSQIQCSRLAFQYSIDAERQRNSAAEKFERLAERMQRFRASSY